jgi:uncharacterized protein (UPF0332 family)
MPEVHDLWRRAVQTLETARGLVGSDPDSAASRAYYAAFHAVTAIFASEGKSFRRHSAVETAVHRDLVNTGRCSEEFGIAFSKLAKLRSTADYGSPAHISSYEAMDAASKAAFIIDTLRELLPPEIGKS